MVYMDMFLIYKALSNSNYLRVMMSLFAVKCLLSVCSHNSALPSLCPPGDHLSDGVCRGLVCLQSQPRYCQELDLLTKKESELQVDAFNSDFQRVRGQKDAPNHPF